jgi:indolepyruvate ferredoxin oxidoreductase alpha subunit
MARLAEYSESFPLNRVVTGSPELGIVTSGISYQYAREALPLATFFKLCMTFPLPEKAMREFATGVKKVAVVEELEPFLEEQIKVMGIATEGKSVISRIGELNQTSVIHAAVKAGWASPSIEPVEDYLQEELKTLPKRPPLLCPGCPHSGIFSVLSSLGIRRRKEGAGEGLVIAGDIGCYTLAACPPLSAMDTCACMGAGIGQALGMEKAGLGDKVVAVIGDSTFLHSGITGLINAAYNKSGMTLIILDNRTTAMTGHQQHPATGLTAQGGTTAAVDLAMLAKSCGAGSVQSVDAFDMKSLRSALKTALGSPELEVLMVRGECAAISAKKSGALNIDSTRCSSCDVCLMLGCAAIRKEEGKFSIDATLCVGCTLCQQLCPQKAVGPAAARETRVG